MLSQFLDFDPAHIAVILSAIIVFVLQLILCFKSRKILIKLLPVIILSISSIAFIICSIAINGWDGLGYLFFGFLSLGLLIICGICWIIWAISKNKSS